MWKKERKSPGWLDNSSQPAISAHMQNPAPKRVQKKLSLRKVHIDIIQKVHIDIIQNSLFIFRDIATSQVPEALPFSSS